MSIGIFIVASLVLVLFDLATNKGARLLENMLCAAIYVVPFAIAGNTPLSVLAGAAGIFITEQHIWPAIEAIIKKEKKGNEERTREKIN